MMHGRFDLPSDGGGNSLKWRLARPLIRHKWIMVVVLPTLLVTLYFTLLAANQYESEAHFLVRSSQPQAQAPSGLGQALSMLGGGGASVSSDVSSVSDYLSSHDAVAALRDRDDLVGVFRRPEADFLSKLWSADPSPERLLRYYRGHADVKVDPETGITSLRVRTFRPQDSYRLMDALLRLGEARVNTLNRRSYESTLGLARRQLAEAEVGLIQSQAAVTAFRQNRRNIDPIATGQAQIGVVSTLRGTLAQARAQRAAMQGMNPSSPAIRGMDARVAALEAQVSLEGARLTGNSSAIAADVGNYQGLQLRQQFAAKRYEDSAAALQQARIQAIRQQLFVVRVVEPNMPVKALYPESLKIVGTVLAGLILLYSLGWLIAAGVREHAA